MVLIFTLLSTGCDKGSVADLLNHKSSDDLTSMDPKDQVQGFYTWYLGQFVTDSQAFRSPLADRLYRDSGYLTPSLIHKIDELLDGFSAIGYDPFLCTQDIPTQIHVDGFFINEGIANVVVHTDLLGHYFSLDLKSKGSGWFIDDVICAWTPAGTTRAFFIWYLANATDPSTGKLRNFLLDERYYLNHFVTPSFLNQAKKISGVNPVLFNQDFPQGFQISPGPNKDTVIVQLIFEPVILERELLVSLVQETGRWVIDDISLVQ
jgi:hypothetical protein